MNFNPGLEFFCLLLVLLIPLATAGLALVSCGLGRSRDAAQSITSSICAVAIAALVSFVVGFSWQSFAGQPAHVLTIYGKPWNWIGADPFFFRGLNFDQPSGYLIALFQVFTVGLAALIPIGSGSGRWRIGASCVSSLLLAGFTYPIFAHWVWGGGWLSQLATNFGLGRGFVDVGGAGAIQTVGGLTALSVAWILGPRHAKRATSEIPAALPGHNTVYVVFGCILALVGWLGLNCSAALLFSGVSLEHCPPIILNTVLAAAGAGLTAAATTRIRFRRPDASLTANGWCGGLVAISAACAFVKPAEAVLIGLVAGALVAISAELLEFKLRVDDPAGAISVHALAGIWGVISVALFARFPVTLAGQMTAQVIGLATLLGFIFPLTYGLNWVTNRFYPYRVPREGEPQGMDLHDLGANAYPEFVTHMDDFT